MLLLIAMTICGTIVLKIFDLILKLDFVNIWIAGFQAGFGAWIGWIACEYHRYNKNRKQQKIKH